ncbi:hypothetical protein A0H81_14752 [Grifola frondosa]|uniref:Uncharacterized protein n=1 Tax=Grifola frondosa TaxID=5627 RepID=A0A1C7LKG0_GRIFR|nr:hypothetical protein A0H81_14752 [Grifola frondosa]
MNFALAYPEFAPRPTPELAVHESCLRSRQRSCRLIDGAVPILGFGGLMKWPLYWADCTAAAEAMYLYAREARCKQLTLYGVGSVASGRQAGPTGGSPVPQRILFSAAAREPVLERVLSHQSASAVADAMLLLLFCKNAGRIGVPLPIRPTVRPSTRTVSRQARSRDAPSPRRGTPFRTDKFVNAD